MRAYTHLAPFGGVNENTNGLPREYCPKHQGIVQYSDGYIEKAVDIEQPLAQVFAVADSL